MARGQVDPVALVRKWTIIHARTRKRDFDAPYPGQSKPHAKHKKHTSQGNNDRVMKSFIIEMHILSENIMLAQ